MKVRHNRHSITITELSGEFEFNKLGWIASRLGLELTTKQLKSGMAAVLKGAGQAVNEFLNQAGLSKPKASDTKATVATVEEGDSKTTHVTQQRVDGADLSGKDHRRHRQAPRRHRKPTRSRKSKSFDKDKVNKSASITSLYRRVYNQFADAYYVIDVKRSVMRVTEEATGEVLVEETWKFTTNRAINSKMRKMAKFILNYKG